MRPGNGERERGRKRKSEGQIGRDRERDAFDFLLCLLLLSVGGGVCDVDADGRDGGRKDCRAYRGGRDPHRVHREAGGW